MDGIKGALMLLTRLPVTGGRPSAAGFLAAGLLVGAVSGAIFWLIGGTVGAVLALGVAIVLTGGLHEDGLADSVDGLFGGWTREQRLEIMRDSRIGSYGALALGLSLIARFAALSALTPAAGALGLVAAHSASRAALPLLMTRLAAARADGQAASMGPGLHGAVPVAIAGAVLTALLAGPVPLIAGLVAIYAAAALMRRLIGGYTGDTLGGTQQLIEVAVLVALAA